MRITEEKQGRKDPLTEQKDQNLNSNLHCGIKKAAPWQKCFVIDASKYFEKRKTQSIMTAEHIEHVMDLYTKRQSVEKEAFLASFDKIKENGYNLNLVAYAITNEHGFIPQNEAQGLFCKAGIYPHKINPDCGSLKTIGNVGFRHLAFVKNGGDG